ncbi:EamA family transporter [Streptomyces sp. MMG1121]|uniref:EamA family transporter n=1 Tax=Streptomyces sp. MMG1121 TaxID=1415544 RepID=UPI000AF1C103|nr:EamA family transporter [Streptomyces sp. MMG1121]
MSRRASLILPLPKTSSALWRNCLGFAVLGSLLLLLRRREVVRVARGERGILRREQWRSLVSGFLAVTALALHFAPSMTSTRLTSVVISTALVATQPVWQALIAAGQGVPGVPASRRPADMGGLALCVVGAAATGGFDIRSGATALLGVLLALVGAIAPGRVHRAERTVGYGCEHTAVFGVHFAGPRSGTPRRLPAGPRPLTGFGRSTQPSLLGLLVLPRILGIGSLNFALCGTSATSMTVLLLLETPVAALAAWWFMGQGIKPATVSGLLLITVGVTVVVTSGGVAQATAQQGGHRSTGIPPT